MGGLNTNDNPALTIGGLTAGGLTAAVLAVMAIIEAFDLYDFTDNHYMAIAGAIAALWAVVVPMVFAIRGIAYAPSTVEAIKEDLAAATPVEPQTASALAK
jgi:hypothetical protein